MQNILLCLLVPLSFSVNLAWAENPFPDLYQQALFAEASYESVPRIKKTCTDAGYTLSQVQSLPKDNIRYFIAENRHSDTTLIAIRGTYNIENALLDLDSKLVNNTKLALKSHQGFTRAANTLYAQILPSLNKNHGITVTGHSLGGAVAVLLAMYLDKAGYSINQVTTFGQPKVSNRGAIKQFPNLKITRVVNEEDMIPLLPPVDLSEILRLKIDIFWHVGRELVLLSGPYYSELQGLDSLLRGIDLIKTKPSTDNLLAHTMQNYVKQLREKTHRFIEIPFGQRHNYLPEHKVENAI